MRTDWRDKLSRGMAKLALAYLAENARTLPLPFSPGPLNPGDEERLSMADLQMRNWLGPAFCGRTSLHTDTQCTLRHYVAASLESAFSPVGLEGWEEKGLQITLFRTDCAQGQTPAITAYPTDVNIGEHAVARLFRRLRLDEVREQGPSACMRLLAPMLSHVAVLSGILSRAADEQGSGQVIAPIQGGALLGYNEGRKVFLRTVVSTERLSLQQKLARDRMEVLADLISSNTHAAAEIGYATIRKFFEEALTDYRQAQVEHLARNDAPVLDALLLDEEDIS